MTSSFLLICFISGGMMLLQVLAFLLYHRRYTWRYRKRIVATIQQMQVWLDGWYIIAVWTDVLTGKDYTFYSRLIEYGLKQRVGESVIVDVDPNDYARYHMQV